MDLQISWYNGHVEDGRTITIDDVFNKGLNPTIIVNTHKELAFVKAMQLMFGRKIRVMLYREWSQANYETRWGTGEEIREIYIVDKR